MSPDATQRIRRVTALLAVLWAVSALVLAIHGQLSSRRTVAAPLQTSAISGVALVSWCSDAAVQAGVKLGDRVIEVEGIPVRQWYRDQGWDELRDGIPIRYLIETREGESFEVELFAEVVAASYERILAPIILASISAPLPERTRASTAARISSDRFWSSAPPCSSTFTEQKAASRMRRSTAGDTLRFRIAKRRFSW